MRGNLFLFENRRGVAALPRFALALVLIAAVSLLSSCPGGTGGDEGKAPQASAGERPLKTGEADGREKEMPDGEVIEGGGQKFTIKSAAFAEGGMIPAKYTADGENISPPLSFAGVPDGAESLVLIVDDPDAPMGTWDHWIVFNVPPSTVEIAEGQAPAGAVLGRNSWKKLDYGGPSPPSGTHHYKFKLYALDTMLNLKPGARKMDVERAMQGHILDEVTLTGLYSKRR